MPERQDGVNFDNCFYIISASEVMSGATKCARAKKFPLDNCYTSAPARLDFRIPGDSVIRMERFLSTTFAGSTGALEMFLSYLALVARSVRPPGGHHNLRLARRRGGDASSARPHEGSLGRWAVWRAAVDIPDTGGVYEAVPPLQGRQVAIY